MKTTPQSASSSTTTTTTTTPPIIISSNSSSDNNSSNSKAYFNFVNSIKSPASRKTYEFSIKKYMQYYNLQVIDDLLADKNTPTVIEDQIIAWLVSLRDTITYNTRHTYLAAILTFYEINDIPIRRKRIARFLGQESTRKNKDRAYTTEEIRKMLEHADIRSKVLVLLLASSGMRIGAVPDLKLRHLTKIPEPYNLYKITVYENTREEYNAYCTPECAAAIDAYIAYRQEKGEKITSEAPLIRESFDKLIKDKNESEGDFFSTTKKAPETLAIRGIGAIISNLLVRAGIVKIRSRSAAELQKLGKYNSGGGSVRKPVRRAHGMRKYLMTALAEVQVDPQYRKMLLGQDIGLDTAYLKPTEQQLLQKYVKVIDSITINNEHRLQQKVAALEEKQDDVNYMKLEQLRKDKRLEELEKNLQSQLQTQQKQQKILETIWNNMAVAASPDADTEKKKKKNQRYDNNDDDDDNYSNNNIHVSKLSLTWQKRGGEEEKESPITAAETFVLADGKNNKLAKDMSPEDIGQLPWRTLVSQEELRKRLSA